MFDGINKREYEMSPRGRRSFFSIFKKKKPDYDRENLDRKIFETSPQTTPDSVNMNSNKAASPVLKPKHDGATQVYLKKTKEAPEPPKFRKDSRSSNVSEAKDSHEHVSVVNVTLHDHVSNEELLNSTPEIEYNTYSSNNEAPTSFHKEGDRISANDRTRDSFCAEVEKKPDPPCPTNENSDNDLSIDLIVTNRINSNRPTTKITGEGGPSENSVNPENQQVGDQSSARRFFTTETVLNASSMNKEVSVDHRPNLGQKFFTQDLRKRSENELILPDHMDLLSEYYRLRNMFDEWRRLCSDSATVKLPRTLKLQTELVSQLKYVQYLRDLAEQAESRKNVALANPYRNRPTISSYCFTPPSPNFSLKKPPPQNIIKTSSLIYGRGKELLGNEFEYITGDIDEKSWVTSTIRIGAKTNRFEESQNAYQRIQKEIEREKERQTELENQRKRIAELKLSKGENDVNSVKNRRIIPQKEINHSANILHGSKIYERSGKELEVANIRSVSRSPNAFLQQPVRTFVNSESGISPLRNWSNVRKLSGESQDSIKPPDSSTKRTNTTHPSENNFQLHNSDCSESEVTNPIETYTNIGNMAKKTHNIRDILAKVGSSTRDFLERERKQEKKEDKEQHKQAKKETKSQLMKVKDQSIIKESSATEKKNYGEESGIKNIYDSKSSPTIPSCRIPPTSHSINSSSTVPPAPPLLNPSQIKTSSTSALKENGIPPAPQLSSDFLLAEMNKVQLKPTIQTAKVKQMDVREDLMEAIRNAGGVKSLRKINRGDN